MGMISAYAYMYLHLQARSNKFEEFIYILCQLLMCKVSISTGTYLLWLHISSCRNQTFRRIYKCTIAYVLAILLQYNRLQCICKFYGKFDFCLYVATKDTCTNWSPVANCYITNNIINHAKLSSGSLDYYSNNTGIDCAWWWIVIIVHLCYMYCHPSTV